jgi:fructokinase
VATHTPLVTVVGEGVADAFVVPATGGGLTLRVRPGGGPVNTAVALARLGTPTRFLGRLSRGVLGAMLREHLVGSGVDVSAVVDADGPASLAIASVDADGRAAYEFHLTGTTDWQWHPAELAARTPADAACVHTGSLALALEPGARLIEAMLARVRPHATVSVDPNVRPGLVSAAAYPVLMRRWAGLADVIRLSDEDLAGVLPGASIERACDEWHAAGAALVVVTRGAAGAVFSLRGERGEITAPRVAVVDTVGAGDAFTAGLLHGLGWLGRLGGRLDGLTLVEVRPALEFAARVAAATCAVAGADPPWPDQIEHRLGRGE